MDSSITGSTESLTPRDCLETTVAYEIEAVHEVDSDAKLYERVVGWNDSQEALYGAGTLGAVLLKECESGLSYVR